MGLKSYVRWAQQAHVPSGLQGYTIAVMARIPSKAILKGLAVVFIWALAPAFLPGAVAASSYSAAPSAGKTEVVYLEPASVELKASAADLTVSDGALWEKAQNLFEGITRKESTEFGPFVLQGWTDPDLKESNRKGTVDSIQEAFAGTLEKPGFKTRGVPAPCNEECKESLRDALNTGQALKSRGQVMFDGEDGQSYLPASPGVVGAFVYSPYQAIGVFYSDSIALIAKYVGDTVAAATAAHEYGHADDFFKGKLDPKRVKEGEKSAFKRQYDYLVQLDPKGYVLAKLRYGFVGKPWVPQVVSEYLEHLAMVRLYGDAGDFDGLVDRLGYQDPHQHPFHQHGQGDDHPKS